MARSALPVKADHVIVYKAERLLVLLYQGHTLRRYGVALGPNPQHPKRQRGDGRTPEGSYILDWRNPDSDFYRSIHISYPSPEDRGRAQISGVDPGDSVMIHALPPGREWIGKDHQLIDWTEGCIAVTNAEMDEIWSLVEDGTPIDIKP